MKLRTIKRFIEQKLKTGTLALVASDADGEYVFSTRMGRIVGIIDRGDFYDLHDMHNPNDKPGNPTATIIKGKKLRIVWQKNQESQS